MSYVLQGNCCETGRNIPQKSPMDEFTKKNSLTRQMFFWNVSSNFLKINEIFDEVAVGSWFVLFEIILLLHIFRNN